MNYDALYGKKQIKIPTLLSIFIVGVIMVIMGQFFFSLSTPSRASKKTVRKMEVANVFSNQATIVWQTDQKETGWIVYGPNKSTLASTGSDDRDLTDTKSSFSLHYVTLSNLKPDITYYFRIIDNSQSISQANGEPFSFKTPPANVSVNNLSPAYGKIVDEANHPVENALLLLYINHAAPLAALSKGSGEWLIPLNYVLDVQNLQSKSVGKQDVVQLQISDEAGESSLVKSTLGALSPLANPLTMGKDYNLIQSQSVLSASTQQTSSSDIEITFPKQNTTLPVGSPLIKGKAIPNSSVTVSVTDGKSATEFQLKADKDGTWQANLAASQRLAAGSHLITLTATDKDNKSVTRQRTFTVAKSGEQVLGDATGSATPTVTSAPITTDTPTVEPTTEAVTATETPAPPVTGANITYLGLTSVALILAGLGILVAF